jgi:hypothetical protein
MTPPPCLNDARPRALKRGEMTAKVSINSIILRNIWISIENLLRTQIGLWTRRWSQQDVFGLSGFPAKFVKFLMWKPIMHGQKG